MANDSAEGLSDNAVGREELRRVFSTLDRNGDGLISKQEMREYFDSLRLFFGEEDSACTIRTVDVNGDGYVDFDEFVTLYESMIGKPDREEEGDTKADHEDADLAEAFGVFDENGHVFINMEELQCVLKSVGLQEGRAIGECEKVIQTVDEQEGGGGVQMNTNNDQIHDDAGDQLTEQLWKTSGTIIALTGTIIALTSLSAGVLALKSKFPELKFLTFLLAVYLTCEVMVQLGLLMVISCRLWKVISPRRNVHYLGLIRVSAVFVCLLLFMIITLPNIFFFCTILRGRESE